MNTTLTITQARLRHITRMCENRRITPAAFERAIRSELARLCNWGAAKC